MQEQITREPVVFRVARSARGLVGWRPEISAASLNYKPRTRFGVGLIGFVFCVANAAVFTAAVGPFLKGEQSYSDLVGSAIAWGNVDKGFDFRVFQVFLATFGLLVALLVSLCRRLETSHEMKAALERGLALALTPGALWLGGRLVTNSFGSAAIDCVLSGAAVLTLCFLLTRPRLAATPENIGAIVNASLLGLVLAFFAGLGLATAISRIYHAPITKDTTIWLVTATCGSAFLAVARVILLSSQAAEIRERIRHVIFGSQIFLPLLCTVIVAPAVVENGSRIVAHPSIALTRVPVALWNNAIARALVALNAALIRLSKGLFAYQISVRTQALPTVNNLWKKQLGLAASFDNLHLPCIRRGCQLCAV